MGAVKGKLKFLYRLRKKFYKNVIKYYNVSG